jgi:septal ring factor EnvC (AmiA/AmiB activator)
VSLTPKATALVFGLIAASLLDAHASAGQPARPPAPQPPATNRVAAATANLKAIDARLAQVKAEATALAGEQRTLLGRLRQLELTRQMRALERERSTARLADVSERVSEASARVEAADQGLMELTPEVRGRVARLYKLLPIGYDRLLLNLDDARAFDRAARMVAVLARRDRERLEEFQRLRVTRRAEVARLGRKRASLEGLQAQLSREEEALIEAMAEQQVLLSHVREQRDVTRDLLAELAAARDRLDQSVQRLTAGATRSPTSTAGLSGLRITAGTVAWPVEGRLAARFGREASSRFGTAIARNGIEIEARPDAPVRAVLAGQVAFADIFTGFGRVVILDHGNKAYSLYGHLASLDVNKGQQVSQGQSVGIVGTAPAGSPSLYFELRIDGRPVDPVQWLKR